jgi:hypothetical protein
MGWHLLPADVSTNKEKGRLAAGPYFFYGAWRIGPDAPSPRWNRLTDPITMAPCARGTMM